jgi:glycerol transport system ATP-binding protein
MRLALENVTRRIGDEVHIHRTDLALEPGLNVLLGPTTAGKTSLMRLMAGLDRPTTGRVVEDGTDVTGKAVRTRSVAMVYQQFINYPSFTLYENIASPLRLAGFDRATVDDRVRATARTLRIEDLLDRLPAQLSGGQQQRCAIARALVKEANLLLLDEPLVNLDYKLREELRAELRAIFAARDAVVVYATTEPMEALIMGGSVVVLDEGRALQSGPTLDVYRHPASMRVAQVFSDPPMNLVPGRIHDGRVRMGRDVTFAAEGHLADLAAGDYTFGVRASHLTLTRSNGHEVTVPAAVELSEISGSETFIHAEHGETRLVVQEEGVHAHEMGSTVDLFLDPARVFAFAADTGALAAAPTPQVGG